MNVDEAMKVAAKQGGLPETDEWHGEVIDALDVLSAEVERLRAELAAAKAASVVPVEVLNIREVFLPNGRPMWTVEVRFEFLEHRTVFADWLRKQIEASGRQVPAKEKPVVDARTDERG